MLLRKFLKSIHREITPVVGPYIHFGGSIVIMGPAELAGRDLTGAR